MSPQLNHINANHINAPGPQDHLTGPSNELFLALRLPKSDTRISETQGIEPQELPSSTERTDSSSRYEELWSNLARYDVPSELDRRYLCTLIDLLEKNPPKDEMSLARVIASLVDHCLVKGHEDLVHLLGERALALLHSNDAALECATPFIRFEAHNVQQHPYLKPWITLLAERGGSVITIAFLDELAERIGKGERSSSDLLMTVACLSQDPMSAVILGAFREKLSSSLQSSRQEQQRPQGPDTSRRERVTSELMRFAITCGLATTAYAFILGPDSISLGRVAIIASATAIVQTGTKLVSQFLKKRSSEAVPQEAPARQPHPSAPTKSQYAAQDVLDALAAKLDSRSCTP